MKPAASWISKWIAFVDKICCICAFFTKFLVFNYLEFRYQKTVEQYFLFKYIAQYLPILLYLYFFPFFFYFCLTLIESLRICFRYFLIFAQFFCLKKINPCQLENGNSQVLKIKEHVFKNLTEAICGGVYLRWNLYDEYLIRRLQNWAWKYSSSKCCRYFFQTAQCKCSKRSQLLKCLFKNSSLKIKQLWN